MARSSSAATPAFHFRDPPAHAHEQETPVVKELRRFPLDRMTDELEGPSDDEQRDRQRPPPMPDHGRDEERQRHHDQRNPQRVTETVDRVLMAVRVLRNPLVPGFAAEHVRSPCTAGLKASTTAGRLA